MKKETFACHIINYDLDVMSAQLTIYATAFNEIVFKLIINHGNTLKIAV